MNNEQNGQSATATLTQPKKPAIKPRRLPPFKLILHNDDVNEMDIVVRTIVELTPLQMTDAIQKMLEAHSSGCALLLVTHRERAELYVEQFASCKITTSIEPDSQ